jgi:hypothetical protein
MDDMSLPPGVDRGTAERLAAVLLDLYPEPDDANVRSNVTRVVIWQAVGTMIAKGAPDEVAAQTVVAVVMELLVDGMGARAAADHLRAMARQLEREAQN